MADGTSTLPSSVKVDVWNRALSRIGHTDAIEDENDVTLQARECRKHWDDCVGEALELRDWDFAKMQSPLLAAPAGTSRFGWAKVYSLPPDLVAPRALLQGGLRVSLDPEETRIPYELQMNADGTGQLLCTDANLDQVDALEYTSRLPAVAMWPRLFLSAVVYRLAAELALAIIKGREGNALWRDMLGAFESGLAVAHVRRTRAATQDQDIDSASIRARS